VRRHRKSEGFNLAFLDIMSCGLGAVVLVFMLVKHNVDNSVLETDLLTNDVARLQQQEQELQEALDALRDVSKSEAEKIAQLKAKISKLESELRNKKSSLVNKKDKLAALKNDIKNAPRAKKEDVVEDDRGGEENYLMGLRVEGARIAILLDTSASMTDERLIDVIRRKNGTLSDKVRGPKWVRTKKVVKWLLARVPKGSETTVISYNDQATTMGPKKWFDAKNASSLTQVYQAIDKLVPTGPTNLQKGLKVVSQLQPTSLYVVTDGLPTVGDSRYASLNPFASCSSLLGKSNTISGECRVKLFQQSLKDSAPKSVKVNVVLLPIEGDPDAANEYWKWTAQSGGLLISPAENWP
jgi:myosin heavy subunit